MHDESAHVILCERSEPRTMGHERFSSFEARKIILRGAQERAPLMTTANPLRGDDARGGTFVQAEIDLNFVAGFFPGRGLSAVSAASNSRPSCE
jgi:hypothetical protein